MDKAIPDLMTILWHSAGNLYWKDRKGCYLGCNKNAANIFNLPLAGIKGDITVKSELGKGSIFTFSLVPTST